jgi:dTDP-4-dehydrorhamnose reductase
MKSVADSGKVLIAGGEGMLATYISRVMGERGILVGKQSLDIRRTDQVKQLLNSRKWAAVINTAGVHGGSRKKLFDIHAFSAAEMATCCFKRNIPFAFISTARVFDGKKKGAAYIESDQPNPCDDYGLSKYLGEQFVINDGAGMPYYIFRLPMLFGERRVAKERQVIYRLMDLSKREKDLKVAMDVYHSPVSTLYAAQRINKIIQEKMPSGIYHITANDQASLYEIVQLTFKRIGITSKINPVSQDYFNEKKTFPRNLALSSQKHDSTLGWESAVEQFASEMTIR